VRQHQTLIDTYVRHAIFRQPEDFWAWQDVYEIVHGPDGGAAFRLVVDLVRAVPDDRLKHVAAGPVEDLVENFSPLLTAPDGRVTASPINRWAGPPCD
jgi:hypothetical protein